jgi:ArsR family transcriptional regulator, arsenate/arsenite/antimonite-responsive transcriptional repressor
MNALKSYKETFIDVAEALQALAHPARLQVIEHLAKYHECPAGQISNELPISKSTVSQHMTKLREAGFIVSNQDGLCQNYRLNHKKLNEAFQQMATFAEYLAVLSKSKITCKEMVTPGIDCEKII